MLQQINTMGWDIGGAHLKAATLDHTGKVLGVYQQPCQLWNGLDQLQTAVKTILQQASAIDCMHAVTMTGELVDLFADRHEGVQQITATIQRLLPIDNCFIYAGNLGFIPATQLQVKDYDAVASANWLASASFAAQKLGNGLFVDIGSTTTDILLLQDSKVLAQGYSDYARLVSQELIYTGIVRSAVMAVAQTAIDQGQNIGVMAEYFATMADVYRVTGELNENHDQTDTADGAEKTIIASAIRLSRMIGSDFSIVEMPRWQAFAHNIRAQQLQKIKQAFEYRLKDNDVKFRQAIPVLGAGIGRFLVKEIAQQLNMTYFDFSDLCPQAETAFNLMPADCAPAVAVAYLLEQQSLL